MRILRARSVQRFVEVSDEPQQVVQVTVTGSGPATVSVVGRSVTTAVAANLGPSPEEGPRVVEVAVAISGDRRAGRSIDALAVVDQGDDDTQRLPFELIVAEPGWRMFMVSHFHYDPVWWNTQAFYTETWEKLPREQRPWEGRRQQPAFTLIDAHLDVARRDPDYRFVLAELDYLKPFWDTFPWRRDEIRGLLAAGRLELMGGTYNEPNTNLTSAESTARNAVYGIGYQREVLGGAPASAWQLDAFGHDPQFPGMMADAGLTSSSWARGPFHQWGPSRSPGGNPSMQFASEFEWVSPSGSGLLTSYMPNHYSAGWELDAAPDLGTAMEEAYRLFTELASVSATRNVLLPVGSDYTPPNRWMTAISRSWNERYLWPRFEVSLPRDFFDAVRAELTEGPGPTPQTRDMNPIYTGKDVSYIDTKQAQRDGENLLLAAERFGTVAAMLGARYPWEALDKAWRQLLYGAHHDGITGTESDQVYLDLLGGWRDTYELAGGSLDGALSHVAASIDTRGPGLPLIVFNALSWSRTDPVSRRIESDLASRGLRVLDDAGRAVPFVLEDTERDQAGNLCAFTVTLVASDVPSLGYRTYWLVAADDLPEGALWADVEGACIANETYELAVDPGAGGSITSLRDRRDGTDLIAVGGAGNEVLAYEEYPTHPEHGEGPWHLTPTGKVERSSDHRADVIRETSAIGERLTVRGEVAGCALTQNLALYRGVPRVSCVTDVDGFDGQDTLFRVHVAANVPGGLPLSEVGNAVVGRGAGFPNIDVADAPYTLDNPAYGWFGVGTTARVLLGDDTEPAASRAIAVAEVVAPDGHDPAVEVRQLVVALVRRGVTSTVSRGDGPRYGSMDTDSNLPDVRLAIGGPEHNGFVAQVLAAAGQDHADELHRQLRADGTARVWVPSDRLLSEVWQPNADLRGVRDLPVLIVAGIDEVATRQAVREAVAELDHDASILVTQPSALHRTEDRAADRTVAIVNRGLPGCSVDVDGGLYLSLMRSCSGWPSGVWLDPPRRTVPDGSSFQFQHWTHRFEYGLVGGTGDWRDLGIVRQAYQHHEPLRARTGDGQDGPLPSHHAFLTVDSDDVVVTTLKPSGNPLARMADPDLLPAHGITLRAYEANGRAGPARMQLHWPITAAHTADLLEEERTALPVEAGAVTCGFEPYEIRTMRFEVAGGGTSPGPELGRRREPAQPVFGDYWLHNKGAAPLGYQPVTARIVERAVSADGPFDVDVVVASGRTDAEVAGTVELVAPRGWEAEPARRGYHLDPGGHDRFHVRVLPAEDATPGRWFVAVRLVDDAGQTHEDVVTVDLGDPAARTWSRGGESERRLYLERATRKAAVMERPVDSDRMAPFGGELTAELLDDAVTVAPGETSELRVRLHNHVAAAIRGEVQIISPWGTWDLLHPWTTGFEVEAGLVQTVAFQVGCPPGTPPTSAWALAKVMYFGRLLYTRSVPVVFGARPTERGWS